MLEIVIVLGLAAMIAGGAIAMMVYSADERGLRDVSGKVEVLAKRARTIAILQQTPYALEFRAGVVRLLPFAEAGQEPDASIFGQKAPKPAEDPDAEKKREPVRDKLDFPENMAVSIRRWNTQSFIPLERNALQIWRFDPDGLCEPVSLHYTLPKGWAEDTFHPLTGAVSESQIEVR